jgi:hypothetical protein
MRMMVVTAFGNREIGRYRCEAYYIRFAYYTIEELLVVHNVHSPRAAAVAT